MPKRPTTFAPDTLVSSAELAQVIGIDLETVNNWLRRGIISRSPVGGRQLRNRLFSMTEVYRAAFIADLVKLESRLRPLLMPSTNCGSSGVARNRPRRGGYMRL
jgi:hypothetical protein